MRFLPLLLAVTGSSTSLFAASVVCVQHNYATPQGSQSPVTVGFNVPQNAGDVNVVVIGWNDSSAAVTSISDSEKNTYTLAVGPTIQIGYATQSIYYAKNIKAAGGGQNAVTVTFNRPAVSPDIRILEYSGLDPTKPIDVVAAGYGNSSMSSSGTATTTNSNDLLFGANLVLTYTAGPGNNFTGRVVTSPDGDIAEDAVVTKTGAYSVTAPLGTGGPWIMQMVAFRTADSSSSGTSAPEQHSVSLTWVPSTSPNVVSYSVSRVTGTGTGYSQIAGDLTGAAYTDTSVLAGTTYTYVVQSTDNLGNQSSYSKAVTVSVPSP